MFKNFLKINITIAEDIPALKERKNVGVNKVPEKKEPIITLYNTTFNTNFKGKKYIRSNVITFERPNFIHGKGLGIYPSRIKITELIATNIYKSFSSFNIKLF